MLGVLPNFFWCGQVYLVAGDGASCDVSSTSTRPFDSKICPPGGLLPGSWAAGAPTSGSLPGCAAYSCSHFRGASCPSLHLPLFGRPCGGVSTSRSLALWWQHFEFASVLLRQHPELSVFPSWCHLRVALGLASAFTYRRQLDFVLAVL